MYAKLFTSLYQGTLRGNSHGILVFTNLLAHADKNGDVDMHPKAIAEEVGLSVDQVRAALLELESVDLESRSPDEDGRRITRIDEHRDWGWNVVNYVKYSAIRNADDRREQNRLAQERWRNKQQSKQSKQSKPQSAHIDVDVDVKDKETTRASRTPSVSKPEFVSDRVWADWLAQRKASRATVTETALAGIKREAAKAGLSLQDALAMSCERGWRGFKAEWIAESRHAGNQSGAITTSSDAAAKSSQYLASQRQTPEQRAAAEVARKSAMEKLGRATA